MKSQRQRLVCIQCNGNRVVTCQACGGSGDKLKTMQGGLKVSIHTGGGGGGANMQFSTCVGCHGKGKVACLRCFNTHGWERYETSSPCCCVLL